MLPLACEVDERTKWMNGWIRISKGLTHPSHDPKPTRTRRRGGVGVMKRSGKNEEDHFAVLVSDSSQGEVSEDVTVNIYSIHEMGVDDFLM